MNILKRLRNLWKLSKLEVEEAEKKIEEKRPKMATIIHLNDPIDKFLEK